MHVEAHAVEHAAPAAAAGHIERQVLHREHALGARRMRGRGDADLLAADHGADDGVAAEHRDRLRQHVRAVAEDGHAVGEQHHLVDAVRDVDDRDAGPGELLDDLEQPLASRPAKRGGRLVHDEDARRQRQRLGDLDQLLLADPQARRCAPRGRGRCRAGQQLARRRDRSLRSTIRPARQRLAAEKDVRRDAQLRDEVELLVDDGDARRLGVAHACEADRLAGDPDLAVIGRVDAGEDLHQRRLAGAVLAHQSVDLAAAQVEIHPAQGRHAGEALGDARRLEEQGMRFLRPRPSGSRPQSPVGDEWTPSPAMIAEFASPPGCFGSCP